MGENVLEHEASEGRMLPEILVMTEVEEREDYTGIWADMLKTASTNIQAPKNGNLLVLGDKGCGKSDLLAKITECQQHGTGLALEYNYVEVRGPEESTADSSASAKAVSYLNIWQLGGGDNFQELLPTALHPGNFDQSMALVRTRLLLLTASFNFGAMML